MKTANDIKRAVDESGLCGIAVHECSICRYQCGYVFKDGGVLYDRGCDCVTYQDLAPSSFDDVAAFYNRQADPKIIDQLNAMFGFAEEAAKATGEAA